MIKLFKRERRNPKNAHLRLLIDNHEKEVDEVKEMAHELIATINGDQDWLRKRLLRKNEESNDGHNRPALPCDNHSS